MQQKNIWTMLLIIGTLSSQLCCIEKDPLLFETYKFFNHSEHSIILKAYYFDIEDYDEFVDSIEIGGELIQETEMIFGSKTDAFALADSIQVVFDDKKMATFIASVDTSKFNILSPRNYELETPSDDRNIYSYYFTQEDYLNAK